MLPTDEKARHEFIVLVHRYLYYVEAAPVVSDYIYDQFERAARAALPEDNVVHKVGSSNPWDYPDDVKEYARFLQGMYREMSNG